VVELYGRGNEKMNTTLNTILVTLILVISVHSQESVPSDIGKFLETRPSYKKVDLKTYNASATHYKYDVYFCDSAYTSSRDNVVITALVRKQQIIGYHIQVTQTTRKNSPIRSGDIEKAISMAFDLERYNKVLGGTVGDGRNTTYNGIYVDRSKMNEAKMEAVNELAKKLKP